MAETLLQFPSPVVGRDGTEYEARACGAELPQGVWHGWIECLPLSGGEVIRSPRETTQPNRIDTEYRAGGLTAVYLEGALERALNPMRIVHPAPPEAPTFSEPAPSVVSGEPGNRTTESVLDPFSVYEKGEALLRKQLAALSVWHLVNIITRYGLSDDERVRLTQLPAVTLTDRIVAAVRKQVEGARMHVRSREVDSSGDACGRVITFELSARDIRSRRRAA